MVILAEDLFLLAHDGASGRFLIDTAHLDLGLGGALLLDLVLRERVAPVRHLAKGVRTAVRDRLIAAGVLRLDEHKVLGFIPVHHTPEADTRIHHELADRLYDAVVLGDPPSPETAAVVSLAPAVGLERELFPRSDHRAVRHRMAEIAEGGWVGAAVRHAIDAVNAAMGVIPPRGV
jgi:hypothetical protein